MVASRLTVVNGTVLGADARATGGVADGHVVIEDGRIVAVGAGSTSSIDGLVIDAGGGWITPGFIDVQINGGHGIDLTTEPQRIDEFASHLPRYGVTSFVPTVITCPPRALDAALDAWRSRDGDRPGSASPIGLHLEGPMLAPVRRGAHPQELLVAPAPELIEGWSAATGVVLVTLAPELPGALEVIAALVDRGVLVSLGHTDASAAQFTAGLAAGATYTTHLFNGMRPFGHRDPGPIGAVLADDRVVAGLICDGIHVDPVAVRMAWRALGSGRLNLVSDAVDALGMRPAGTGVRTPDGVLAGSDLALDQAVRNLVAFAGCSVPDAVTTVTSTPADLLGLTDRGRLAPGLRGDVAVLDPALRVVATIVAGVRAVS